MRTHFTRINRVTPQAYQRTFRARHGEEAELAPKT
jgi:hypothetical protein